MSSSVLPMFSSNCFTVSGLTFRYLFNFEFIIVYGIRKCSNFIISPVAVQFSQKHLLKRLPLLYWMFLLPLAIVWCPQVCGFIFGFSILFHWSIFPFLCQYHTILMTGALQYSLKSGRLIPSAPFFFLKTALAIQGLLCFHTHCEFFVVVVLVL